MSSTHGSGLRLAKELSHLRAAEQAQQLLEFAPVVWGGVELEGNPALIKSISECIQSSNALSFCSCSISISSCYGFAGLRLHPLLVLDLPLLLFLSLIHI